jgi:hypothetical protein
MKINQEIVELFLCRDLCQCPRVDLHILRRVLGALWARQIRAYSLDILNKFSLDFCEVLRHCFICERVK